MGATAWWGFGRLSGVTKKLVLPPGTHAGRWTLEGERLGGTITLSPGRRPVCWLMGAPASYQSGPRWAEHDGQLRGHLENSYEAVLVDAHAEHLFPGRTRASAGLGLVGVEVPRDLLFDSVEFQVGGLTELATVRPLSQVQWPAQPGSRRYLLPAVRSAGRSGQVLVCNYDTMSHPDVMRNFGYLAAGGSSTTCPGIPNGHWAP